jgi:hypothetical protein
VTIGVCLNRELFLGTFDHACDKTGWWVHAWC